MLYGVESLILEPDVNSNHYKIINFLWPKDATAIQDIRDYSEIFFQNSNIDIVSNELTDNFEQCIWLRFSNGIVRTVFIDTKLHMLALQNTSTENVIIERGKHYKLRKIIISTTKVTNIPKNINQLKDIKHIEITNNFIEYVSLNEFDGLENLNTLDFSGNKLKYLHSFSSVDFAKLRRFNINNNQLQQLDVCNWHMPALNILDLNHNNLTYLAIGHFNTLEYLSLRSNPLNCKWRDWFLKDEVNRHKYLGHELSCDEKNSRDFELRCSSTTKELWQKNSNLNYKLFQLQEQISNMHKALQKIESILHNHQLQIYEQQNVASNIIESMYRMEIERTHASKNGQ